MNTETNLNPVLAKLASWLDSKSGDKGTWQANLQRLVRWVAYTKKALCYIIAIIAKLAGWIPPEFRKKSYWNAKFSVFARSCSRITGRPTAFNVAMLIVLAWAVSGPIFGFSHTWQLVINTVTTIATFLMVFVIQHTQNRDTEAIQLKLDELIRAMGGAHNALLDLEELEEQELELFRKRYGELARLARLELANGMPDTGTPDVDR